jgi:nucleotide-binding universal stress UspA family protein
MTVLLIVLIIALALTLAALAVAVARRRQTPTRPGKRLPGEAPTRRILFPFVTNALSRRALDAALRLASAEHATLVPVFLARVPLHLPLDSPLPRQSESAVALLEAIEHRAAQFDVPVDARVQRGRTNRHALREAIAHEQFDRIVIAAAAHAGHGFNPEDVAWLLDNAAGEIVVLRPDEDDRLNGNSLNGNKPSSARRRPPQRRRAGVGGPASAKRSPVAR